MRALDPRKIYQNVCTASHLARAMLGLGRIPLFISWNVTFRCNLRCAYCGAVNAPRRECSADDIIAGLKSLRGLGAQWVTFGGGEPLLRPDLGELIRRSRELGYHVFVSTNGWLVPESLEMLTSVDNINFSLDGPREVHDAVRGSGAYDHVIAAAQAVRQAGIPYSFQCTLGTHNLGCLEQTLAIAREQQAWMMLQPATQWLDSSTAPNPIAPPERPYRTVMEQAAALKRAGAPVANSFAGLRHLAQWPNPTPIKCLAARMTATVEPDGAVLSCHQCEVEQFLNAEAAPAQTTADQFQQLRSPHGCTQCWCAPVVELALMASWKPEPIWNTMKRFLLS